MSIPSYGKIWAVGSAPVRDLLSESVVVQEKIDGSQISFRLDPKEGLQVKSKNCQLVLDNAGMFQAGVNELIKRVGLLHTGWLYRGEYLASVKHNHLKYDRVPQGHIVLWDIQDSDSYLTPDELACEAKRIGLDVAPCYFHGKLEHAGQVEAFLGATSMLGGATAEGVVVKNYHRYCEKLGTPLFAKLVRAEFKEDQRREWKTENPSGTDIRRLIGESIRSPARWRKAVQHLKETGQHTGTPKDIGALMQRVSTDIDEEMRAEVAEQLMKWAWKEVKRIGMQGLPEWYKAELLADES